MSTNPTSKTGQPATPQMEEQITPLCPYCDAEINAASVQLQISPNPMPPLPPQMLVIMVVCCGCHALLPIQVMLLINPMEMQQTDAAPPPVTPPPSKIWTPH